MKKIAIILIFIVVLLYGCVKENSELLRCISQYDSNKINSVEDRNNIQLQILQLSINEVYDLNQELDGYIYRNCFFISTDNLNIFIKITDDAKKIDEVRVLDPKKISLKSLNLIDNGMNILDVCEILGAPLESFTSGVSTLTFNINEDLNLRVGLDSEMKIYFTTLYDKITKIEYSIDENCDTNYVNVPNYTEINKISVGMDLEKVIESIGKPHLKVNDSLIVYKWYFNDDNSCLIYFEMTDDGNLIVTNIS